MQSQMRASTERRRCCSGVIVVNVTLVKTVSSSNQKIVTLNYHLHHLLRFVHSLNQLSSIRQGKDDIMFEKEEKRVRGGMLQLLHDLPVRSRLDARNTCLLVSPSFSCTFDLLLIFFLFFLFASRLHVLMQDFATTMKWHSFLMS